MEVSLIKVILLQEKCREQENMMLFYGSLRKVVKILTWRNIELVVKPFDTIKIVKAYIQGKKGTPYHQQDPIFAEKRSEDRNAYANEELVKIEAKSCIYSSSI